MAEHTPFPWRMSASGVSVDGGEPDPDGGWPNGVRVALTSHALPPDVRQANARLIAACPLLLAACEEALRIARIPSPTAQVEALDRAEAALATAVCKARGS